MASSASTTLGGGSASGSLWRASSCRPKLGGALKTSHPPPRPRASAAPCWPIRRRSWSREHRASCGSRMRGPSGPRARASASSAALRSTRRASAAFKRGASQGALESRRRSLALSQARQKIASSLHSLAITFWRPLRQSAGRLGVSPSHRRSTGSCHRARCRSTARPGQWRTPYMCPVGSRLRLLSTSPKQARAILSSAWHLGRCQRCWR